VDKLNTITELSHEFGSSTYVCGGGGNTSVKDDTTLWVKPSGTTLALIKPSDFVAMDRGKLGKLYAVTAPTDAAARETLVKEMMEQAVLPSSSGRASVEAPLHDSLSARYVVHTHPALVNGMTCGKEGKAFCQRLFPQALWMDYVDPGYTLCMEVRRAIFDYKARFTCEPSLIFLKNHGLFVAANEPEDIRKLYKGVLNTLVRHYQTQGIVPQLTVGAAPDTRTVAAATEQIRRSFADSTLMVAASGSFVPAKGPVSPDHIVYAKSYYLTEEPTETAVKQFYGRHGYLPHIVAFDSMTLGVAPTARKAELALELAQDAALVVQLATAFGGIDYMTDRAREFIENWEVESYRSKQL